MTDAALDDAEVLDDFVPVRRTGAGRTQQWIVDELQPRPGVWRVYPYPVGNPLNCATTYNARHLGTDWAVDAHGRLGARWVGE